MSPSPRKKEEGLGGSYYYYYYYYYYSYYNYCNNCLLYTSDAADE